MRRALLLLATASLAALASPALAQTAITPDTGALGVGTNVTQNGNVRTIDGGTRAGGNLFHSFNRFDLGQGDVARWVRSAGDGADIRFVINRVTGGDPSDIAGTINTQALPNADFYFINPAGIVFTEGASINVPGAAYFSTAQQIGFASGANFTVTTPGGSTFSVAPPAAFGFVGGQGAITVTGTNFGFIRPTASLTLAASTISVSSSEMIAQGLRFFAVGSGAATLNPAGPLQRLAGTIDIANSALRINGSRAVPPTGILLSAGTITLDDANLGTAFRPDEPFAGVAGPITLFGARIDIFSGLIQASTVGDEPAGDIRIIGDDIRVSGLAVIQTETSPNSTGPSGSITIAGGNITLTDRTRISANTLNAQRAGDINITGRAILLDQAVVTSSTLAGTSGRAGDIRVAADSLTLRNGGTITSSTDGSGAAGLIELRIAGLLSLTRSSIESRADSNSTGPAGTLDVVAGRIALDDEAILSTTTFGSGRAGLVTILSQDIVVEGQSFIASESVNGAAGGAGLVFIDGGTAGRLILDRGGAIRSSTTGAGSAGGVIIRTGALEVREDSRISSSAEPEGGPAGDPTTVSGSAGDISISAKSIFVGAPRLSGSASIESRAVGSGNAGTITLVADRLEVSGEAEISTEIGTDGTGRAGAIDIDVGDMLVELRAVVSSNSFGTGPAGRVDIDASRSITVTTGGIIRSEMGLDSIGEAGSVALTAPDVTISIAGLLSAGTSGPANGGQVTVNAGRLLVTSGGNIASSTNGDGAGGIVQINADEIMMSEGGYISADSFGPCFGDTCFTSGQAGAVVINTGRLTMIGGADPFEGRPTLISSSTTSQSTAGGVFITADSIRMTQGAQILSVTTAVGDAGNVNIDAGSLVMETGSFISTSSAPEPGCDECGLPSGNAGTIFILADEVRLASGSQILSTTQGRGDAGLISIDAGRQLILDNGRISTQVAPTSTGLSGLIAVNADLILLTGAGRIDTTSFTAAEAGGVLVDSDRLVIRGVNAGIASANQADVPGNAGGIFISADNIDLLDGGRLTTESRLGAAGSIELFLPPTGFLTLDSRGSPSLITTSSGPGTGGRIFIGSPFAIISNGGTILALGQEGGANVEISTQYFISSSDRLNQVAVDGSFLLEAQAYDVSAGTVTRDLNVLDASGVLRGQCAATRATGDVSQLVVRPVGPYGRPPVQGSIAPGSCL